MGLFSSKPKVVVCEMCGKTDAEGCGALHSHVFEIRGDQPAWLPARLRAQAQGEYTWLCVRCDAYPAMKWPHTGGAWAGMMTHLGAEHHAGEFRDMARSMPRIDMIQLG